MHASITAPPAPTGRSPFSPTTGGFLLAEALSAVGSWATIVAIWGYAAYQYQATPGEVSLFGMAFAVPGVVLGPVAGTVVDRLGPKATLAMAKVIGIAAALALLAASDFRTLALLSTLHGVTMALTYPALGATPPRMVDEAHLARTNALVSLTDEFAIVVGPMAAGVTIAAFGFKGAFVFDALTYAVGLAALPLVRLQAVKPATGQETESPRGARQQLRDALDGWALIARTPALRRIVACTFAVHLLYGTALLAEPLYVRDVLHQPESVFAALQTAFGVFLVGGGLLAARAGERMASFGWVALGVGISGVTAIIYLGTPFVVVAFAGVCLWGVATAAISGPSRTLLQRSSPVTVHGRVLAGDLMAANSAELAGVALAGVLVGALGVRWSVTGLGVAVTATAVVLAAADRRASPRAAREGSPPGGG